MVSALPLCVLVVALSFVSSQSPTTDSELVLEQEIPESDRRTLKTFKSVKYLPLLKKHKKFGLLLPHGKTHYAADVPIIHETPIRPIYKVHRYQGIEVKPLPVIESAPEPIVEAHSYLPSHDYAPDFSYGPSFSNPAPPSNIILYPIHQKPILPSIPLAPSSAPIFTSIPAPPPPAPVFQSIPVQPPSVVFPAPPVSLPPPPVLSSPLPPRPAFSFVPVSPSPVPEFSQVKLPPPAPIFSSPSIAIPSPTPAALPTPPLSLPSITPPPIIPSIPVKVPPPALSPIALPPSVPVFPPISIVPPPSNSIIPPAPLPLPPVFSSLPPLPSPPPAFSTPSIPSPPEPEFPYPPSDTPIPSYIKDISLGDISLNPTPTKVESTIIQHDSTKVIENHALEDIKTDPGFLQKFKNWKAEKASAALSHLSHLKQKPFAHHSISLPPPPPVANKIPLEIPSGSLPNSNIPPYPTLQFPGPIHPLPLAPDFKPTPVFLPSGPQFLQPIKYESFPPTGPLFNSYGVPIPPDSYSTHISHDRVAPAASEEEPSILPAPQDFDEQSKQQDLKENQFQQQEGSQQESSQAQFQQDFQQYQPQAQPVYVPEDSKTQNEDSRTVKEAQQIEASNQENNYQTQQDQTSQGEEDPNLHHHRNHKE